MGNKFANYVGKVEIVLELNVVAPWCYPRGD